jgi:hypothetical protein
VEVENRMRIEEQKVYRFVFPFLGQEAIFNVVADSQGEAAKKIIDWMLQTMAELSMAFPKVAPEEKPPVKVPAMEELRIDTLIDELSKYLTKGADTAATVLDWCKMEYIPENYKGIIISLEDIKKNYETGKIRKAGR